MHCGVPYAPLATAYSLQARDYATLRQIVGRLSPGLVFAAEGRDFERALAAVLPAGAELVTSVSAPEGCGRLPFAALAETEVTAAVDEARARVGPDTIAKILYTSGSTGRPKGVVNTQRMLCSNQAMLESVFPFLAEEPPVLCDWLPLEPHGWRQPQFGIVLHHGGTLYIDEGRPLPGLFDATVRNLREVSATAHFTVPRTYEMLLPHLRADPVLRERFFAKLKLFFYAAAGLTQRVFDELQGLAVESCGEELLWVTGMGATETAPFALLHGPRRRLGRLPGLSGPGPGAQAGSRGREARGTRARPERHTGLLRGRRAHEGGLRRGGLLPAGRRDALRRRGRSRKGLVFDGRLAEDFKLSTGTWVHVGALRARILAHRRRATYRTP
jgi:feruloyl-CoA synthase